MVHRLIPTSQLKLKYYFQFEGLNDDVPGLEVLAVNHEEMSLNQNLSESQKRSLSKIKFFVYCLGEWREYNLSLQSCAENILKFDAFSVINESKKQSDTLKRDLLFARSH